MILPRIALAVALLACTSSTALVAAPLPDDGGVPPGGGVKADDYDAGDSDPGPDGLGQITRPDGQPLTPDQRRQLAAMVGRLRAATPQGRDEPEELYDRRVFDLAYRSLAPTWQRTAGVPAAPAPGGPPGLYQRRSREGIVYLGPHEQAARERATQAANEERRIAANTAPGNPSFVQVYRSSWPSQTPWGEHVRDLREQHAAWCTNNPEPCAREQRRIAAQDEQAQREQVRRAQWQVVHARQRQCQPLPEAIQGATTPQDALAAVRQRDPDADFAEGPADVARRPWLTIQTSDEPVLLAKDFQACLTWFRVAFPRG